MNPGVGFSGTRIGLKLTRIENSGEMLHAVRDRTSQIVGPAAAAAVKYVAYFKVVEVRPLI